MEIITAIQAGIYSRHGIRTDAYYREGYGLLIVREGAPLLPRNVIAAYDEDELDFIAYHVKKKGA
ncbi:hypothetical protein P4V86_15600 [Brevibacillus laterosporus]|uniref:hypothetical protein n=1 Tax=Brevibacillus laterosporus TaxID=1465 RepID=UPI000376DD09|nr:hypothetical protein [Brevibacillus laterosporus]ATO50971.1 hypothetical protein BrL25_18855 [Brevibacillus laterosporus DSM 25]MED2004771.1 hypothetical protein [Brevibacillus laterosporus]